MIKNTCRPVFSVKNKTMKKLKKIKTILTVLFRLLLCPKNVYAATSDQSVSPGDSAVVSYLMKHLDVSFRDGYRLLCALELQTTEVQQLMISLMSNKDAMQLHQDELRFKEIVNEDAQIARQSLKDQKNNSLVRDKWMASVRKTRVNAQDINIRFSDTLSIGNARKVKYQNKDYFIVDIIVKQRYYKKQLNNAEYADVTMKIFAFAIASEKDKNGDYGDGQLGDVSIYGSLVTSPDEEYKLKRTPEVKLTITPIN